MTRKAREFTCNTICESTRSLLLGETQKFPMEKPSPRWRLLTAALSVCFLTKDAQRTSNLFLRITMSLSHHPVITTFDKERRTLCVKWTIKDYQNNTANTLFSEIFSHPSAPQNWKLTLNPNVSGGKWADYLSFYLLYGESQTFETGAMFSIGYEDKTGKVTLKPAPPHVFSKTKSLGFGYPALLPKENVNNNLLKPDGSLTLLVEIDYSTLKLYPETQFSLSKLANDLGYALDGDYADIVFKVRKHSLKAHKVIVAYRSKYFKAMFDNDSSEAQTGIIKITDFKFGVIRGLFEFIYKGVIDLTNVRFALSLRLAADKYEVLDLVKICEDYIVAKVDKKTSAKAILSTTLVESIQIRKACLEVFKNHVFKDIDNFADVFKDASLAEYIFDSINVKSST